MKKIALITCLFFLLPTVSFAATIYSNSSTGNDTTGDGSSGNPYATFHKAYTVASAGDTINLTGTFTWTNAGETGDALTSGYTLGKNLTIVGQNAGDTIIQAATASTTGDRRVFTISSASVSVTIDKVTIRNGKIASSNSGGGILNAGVLTLTNSDVRDNSASGYFGGGVANTGTTTIASSSIYRNTASYAGGVVNISTTGYLAIQNSTISYNIGTASTGYPYGGGVMFRYGTGHLTNNTIVYNTANTGGGMHIDDSATVVYLKNNIIANNTATGGASTNDVNRSAGTITDNGYNIVGASNYSFATTGDWTDSDRNGVFTLYTVGTSGTLDIERYPGTNDNPRKTTTHATYSGSISVNNGNATANGTSTVPTTDQRGASRNSTTDIGAYEYGGGGLTISEPTSQTSNITFSNVQYNRVDISWTDGNGARRTVFMKQGSTGTASPVDGTNYSPSTIFGQGSQISSSGWYTIYDGLSTTSSITVTGLTTNTSYIVQAFEYNGVASSSADYITSTASNNPNTQTTYAITTRYVDYTNGDDTSGIGTLNNPYKTFTKGYASSSPGDTLDLVGTFMLSNSDETGDASVTGFTIGKDLTLRGHGADETIFQTQSASTTGDRRIFTISLGVNATTTDMMLRYGRVTGGTDSGGAISNSGILYANNLDVNNSISTQYFGGGLVNFGTTTVENSSFTDNTAGPSGGGIANLSTTAYMQLTNVTVANNRQTWTTAYTSGGGIGIRYGRVFINNSTIAYNSAYSSGSGIYFEDASSYLSMVNTIVAKNTRWGVGAVTDFAKGTGGVITDSGHNIIAGNSGFTWAGYKTWTDTDLNGTYTQNNTAATGLLYLDTVLAYNNNPNKTYTLAATSSSSILVNNGTTTASTTIPTTDQRGATRSGIIDIGAFEYDGGLTDITGPTISSIASSTNTTTATVTWTTDENATSTILYGTSVSYGSSSTTPTASTSHSFILSGLSPSTVYHFAASSTDSSGNTSTSTDYTFMTAAIPDSTAPTVFIVVPSTGEATSSTVTLVASSSDNVAVAGVQFYINGVAQGSEDVSAPYSIAWDSTASSSGSKIIFAVARDSSNNFATSSSVTFTTSNTGATPSSIAVTSATTTATITWTTSAAASSKINFGPTTNYGSTTIEKDISPRVTSHSFTLVNLPRCALINFIVISRTTIDSATSSNNTFTTKGCIGGGAITSSQFGAITTAAGGSINNDKITLTVPTAFTGTTTAATFQAHKLDPVSFFASAGIPNGKNKVGNEAYNLKALTDATTTLSTFTEDLDVSLTYEDSDIVGINENSLWIYRYDSDWNPLTDCSVNKTTNTVTCKTSEFSDFSLFGDEEEETQESVVSQNTKKSTQTLQNRIANIVKYSAPVITQVITNIPVRDLEFGMSGEDVKELQNILISKNTGPKAKVLMTAGATGYFGPITKAAVIEYQIDRAVYPPHGYFGPKTRATLK